MAYSLEDNLLLGIERHDRTDAPESSATTNIPFASRTLDMPHTAKVMCIDSELYS